MSQHLIRFCLAIFRLKQLHTMRFSTDKKSPGDLSDRVQSTDFVLSILRIGTCSKYMQLLMSMSDDVKLLH